jgi:penicillin-binding protein A
LLIRRALPVAVLAFVAFGIGVVCGAGGSDPAQAAVNDFAKAWNRGDYATMYQSVDDDTRKRMNVVAFTDAYQRAASTATARRLVAGKATQKGDRWVIPVTVQTRSFGPVHSTVSVKTKGEDHPRIVWSSALTFPGVGDGQHLSRKTVLPPRANLLARDNTPLTKDGQRAGALGPVSAETVGQLGPIPVGETSRYEMLGYPDDATVGTSGLERALESQLVGTPGGKLLVGDHVLASGPPKPARPVRTTIDPDIEKSAISALAGSSFQGGVVAIRPKTGELLAYAGTAYSALQPPGSTFKIITTTGALQAGVVKPSDSFPVQSAATLSGVQLSNANGEECGGTLEQSFANSCNSVFAPLGAKLGPTKLYEQAVRFGFNRDPGIPGAQTSTIPPPKELGDDLNVGSAAIGQGEVQATALQMGWAATAIADRGRLPRLTLDFDEGQKKPTPTTYVADKKVALEMQKLMLAVVDYGTGTSAQIPGVKVAGKTGTAELRSTQCNPGDDSCSTESTEADTDAWFTSYAPADKPKIAVGVLLISAGGGGENAAPVARQVLATALGES